MPTVRAFARRAAVGLTLCACRDGGNNSLQQMPVTTIPRMDSAGHVQFVHPIAAARLTDGNIVLADAATLLIKYFDRHGHLRQSVGGRGYEAGRFASLSWIGRCRGDSIFAFDFILQQVTVLDSAGSVGRVLVPPPSTAIVACGPDGSLAALSRPIALTAAPRAEGERRAELFISTAAGWQLVDTVIAFNYDGKIGLTVPRPVGRVTKLALTNGSLFVGTGAQAVVDVLDIESRTHASLTVADGSHPVTRANFARAIDTFVLWQSDTVEETRWRNRLRRASLPAATPSYSGLFVDHAETLWVVVSTPGDAVTRLRGYRGGRLVRQANIGADIIVYEIGSDYVLGSEWGGHEPRRVVVYRLTSGEPERPGGSRSLISAGL